jgi:RNA polymerase sigma-70 factor (ECF subfamily)
MVVALNKIRNTAIYHKAAKRDAGKTISAEDFSALPDHSEDGANQQALMFLQSSIDDLLNGLDPIHKRIVELRLEGHEVAHIAQQVGRAKRSVERVLQSFRSELESVLHV